MDSGFDMDDDFGWDEDQLEAGPNLGPPRGPRRGGGFGRGRGFGGPPPNFGGFPPDDFGNGPMGPGPMGPMGPMGPGPMGPGPMGPRGPAPYMWGRGFGPGGPPNHQKRTDNKAIRYLIRCGIAKEHLKNVPRDLLRLIEPEYCGLCGYSFESFATSRLHYISKNHYKNHKKWLAQQNQGGFLRSKEIPLKSRDLYCELCDVQITSKVHADSHYAGKSHRSIVEGRKNPKNPMLLQPGMKERVKQLVRREKKHLKNVEEAEEEVAEVPKETKSVPPELYCDICKTSVTCTEQMTMHLNGKRHLNKEKQHILKMMKTGGTEDDEQEADEEDPESADVETSTVKDDEMKDGEGETPAEGGQDDWENGSGNWDEPAENNTTT